MEKLPYIKRLNIVMAELEKEDNLTISQILNMDMLEYKNQLVERAGKILKERENDTI